MVEVEDRVDLGGKVDVQDSEDTARELLGTGESAQDQEIPPGDKPLAEPGEEVQDEAGAEQEEPEVDEDGNEIPKEVKPGEAQDSVILQEAVGKLNKVAGRKLTDDEAVEAMAGSYVKADAKIQSLSEQLQEAVTYRERYDALVSDPIISQILQGKNPFEKAVETDLDGEEITPAVKGLIARQNQEIQALKLEQQRLSGGVQSADQAKLAAASAEMRTKIDGFAAKPDNADFKEMLLEYRDNQRINRYAPMPDKLKRLGAMMDSGVPIEEAWGVLNPGKVENRLRGNIAAAQKKKLGKGGIALRGKGKAPRVRDLSTLPEMSTEELMQNVVSNMNARGQGEE